ncbi:cytochrome c [Pseudomonas sp. RTC3]|uniref:c-type cytochrome n=1 Tax=Pseudomonas sp. 5C2 TaxID=3048588 RepID=UPI002AB4AA72|nr:cytochrome c [Pseudomonas sp. 5C2]MDY7565228.1 cytochrome c [Pseudomonas sp. 5C2]MEB0061699.1 cytochrome c [Pseudomonas sp. RTC3]MEB0239608.1 cytochrome c [Pseudomonas sp. 5C2]
MKVYRQAVILAALLLICTTAVASPDVKRQAQLEHLLAQDCGACHGLRMTGGLGPELTRAALAGKSRDSLIATVTQGRPGTAMPGWGPLLSPGDIRWLVDLLLQGYPAP